ncbi:patatin-like phospholipase family protein [Synechocystis sp. LEGE 06083]|uniref:patatin-like phospholipase family protein n=1 Tax=Synechocystis sp. LEGE 06083 TaxID=915336 RepID=UPI00187DE424|nr:patatin-like phospholipase family protein [Synechocystis sp. LEGE 06083]MBE9196053.1 patatin-like phospholipase family protein [Synechocystis sp. LEGE 06083]
MKPVIGLVLAGGGAKGAYQVGALTYLAELGLQPHIIAGTSIGALNGAVLASYSSLKQGVNRLNQLWDHLAESPIIRPNTTTVIKGMGYLAQSLVPSFNQWIIDALEAMGFLGDHNAIFNPTPIEDLLSETINLQSLQRGTELWVTVFPSLKIPGISYNLLMAGIDLLRAKTGTQAHWLRAQDCENDEILHNLPLSSAAIPLVFPEREVNGQHYVDGALANNIPLEALAIKGCTHAIIIHLDNGEIWNRQDFPDQGIIEIRPQARINHSDLPLLGFAGSLIDFSPEYISKLKQRGYEDAKKCMQPIILTMETILEQRQSHDSMVNSSLKLLNDEPLF